MAKRFLMRAVCLGALLFFHLPAAEADQGFTYAQITCMPKTDYLTVSTQFVDDINPNGFRQGGTLALIDPEVLQARPFICKMKRHTIKVTADTKTITEPAEMCRSQIGGYNVRILVDGKTIDTLRQVDCDGRYYLFNIVVDSDFPAPVKKGGNYVFFDHCFIDEGPMENEASDPHILGRSKGQMNCVSKALGPE